MLGCREAWKLEGLATSMKFSASQPSGFPAFKPASFAASQPLRHIAFNINRLVFPDVIPFITDIGNDAGILVEAILLIFTPVVNQKIFFFINQF
jgi:hypothetical protein